MKGHSLPDRGRSNRSVSTTAVAHMHLSSDVAKPQAGFESFWGQPGQLPSFPCGAPAAPEQATMGILSLPPEASLKRTQRAPRTPRECRRRPRVDAGPETGAVWLINTSLASLAASPSLRQLNPF